MTHKWIVAIVLALGASGVAFAKAQHTSSQAQPAPVAVPAQLVLQPLSCSHAGGTCSWSGDCCMNENLTCDSGTCTAH